MTLLSFGYTSCPDVCPTHMAAIGRALAAAPPRHPSPVLGYAADGRARVAWPFGTTSDVYAHDLRLLLDETGD
jgi:hypothetical protein